MGRYLVATRDLEPMELVLSDQAAASGPLHEDTVVCLGCLKALSLPSADSAIAICQDCGLPFCSTTCQDDVIHKAQECALFLQRRIKFDNVDQASHRHPLYKVCTKNSQETYIFPSVLYVELLMLQPAFYCGPES